MEKTKSYRIVIKASGLYPAAEKAKALIAETGGKFKTIVTSSGGSLSFFIDEAIPANQYGTQFRCTDDSGNDAKHDEELHNAVKKGEAVVLLEGFDESGRIIGMITIPAEFRITDAVSPDISEAVQTAINAKVAEGIVTEDCAKERVEYMIRNYFFEEDILDVIDHWHSVEGACRHKALYVDPKLEEHHKAGMNGTVLRGVRNVLCGNPVLLKGPKATGKNTFVTTIAWLLGEPLRYHTAGLGETKDDYVSTQVTDNEAADKVANMKAEDIVTCEIIRARHAANPAVPYTNKEKEVLLSEAVFKKLQAQCASVRIIHEYKAYTKWIMYGGVFFLDEFNFADPNLIGELFHGILDHSMSTWEVPGMGDVSLSRNTMMFGAMNPGYQGTNDLNEATKSRFASLELDQPKSIKPLLKSAVSYELSLKGRKDLDDVYYTQASKFYDACQAAVTGSAGRMTISDDCLNVRGLVRALTNMGIYGDKRTTLRQEITDHVITPCDNEERMSLNETLRKYVSK